MTMKNLKEFKLRVAGEIRFAAYNPCECAYITVSGRDYQVAADIDNVAEEVVEAYYDELEAVRNSMDFDKLNPFKVKVTYVTLGKNDEFVDHTLLEIDPKNLDKKLKDGTDYVAEIFINAVLAQGFTIPELLNARIG